MRSDLRLIIVFNPVGADSVCRLVSIEPSCAQGRENERESMQSAAGSSDERERLERIFATERGRASEVSSCDVVAAQ